MQTKIIQTYLRNIADREILKLRKPRMKKEEYRKEYKKIDTKIQQSKKTLRGHGIDLDSIK